MKHPSGPVGGAGARDRFPAPGGPNGSEDARATNSGLGLPSKGFLNFGGTDRHRDLFPLPRIAERAPAVQSLSCSQRRRAARFNSRARMANDIVGTLNDMYAPAGSSCCTSFPPTLAQSEAQRELLRQVGSVSSDIPLYSEREATRTLLQSSLSYSEDAQRQSVLTTPT